MGERGGGPDREDVRRRLLEAAAEEFQSPEYEIFCDVALSRIARRAGISERTAFRYFHTDELRDELPRFILDPSRYEGASRSNEMFRIFEREVLDADYPLAEAISTAAAAAWEANLTNRTLRAQMALWPYAEGNEAIRESLSSLYQNWDDEIRAMVDAFFAARSNSIALRDDWISTRDFALTSIAIVEGLAIRASLHRLAGKEGYGFEPELAGRILQAIFASMIAFPDEDGHSADDTLRRADFDGSDAGVTENGSSRPAAESPESPEHAAS